LNNTIVGASTHTIGIQATEVVVKNNLIIMLDDIAVTRFENVSDKNQIDINIYFKNNRIGNEVISGFSCFSDWQADGGDHQGKNIIHRWVQISKRCLVRYRLMREPI